MTELARPKFSFWAIVVIAANTMNGPGLTTLPSTAGSAGQITFCFLVAIAALVTSCVVSRLCNLMWKGRKIEEHCCSPKSEESDIVALSEKIFRRKRAASWAMIGCALALALAQMMLCAAIADSMLVASMGKSCGVGFPFHVHCTSNLSMKPFQVTSALSEDSTDSNNVPVSLVSAGLLISSSITISLAFVDLNSMLTAQYALFGCFLIACARFCFCLWDMSDSDLEQDSELEVLSQGAQLWIGPSPFDAVGPVLFNFAFVVTIPPLSCGAKSAMGGVRSLVVACIIMGALYTLIGFIGATVAVNTPTTLDNNLLSLVLRGTNAEELNPLDLAAVVLFGLSQLAAIPIYCELARETLVSHVGFRNKAQSFAVSHVLPWIIVALTYNSALFETFVEWSSLLLLGFANFSLPLVLDYGYSVTEARQHHGIPTAGQRFVLWGLALVTAGIAAVIVQRATASNMLAEGVFMGTTLAIFLNS